MFRKILAIAAICLAMADVTARAQIVDLRPDGATADGMAAMGGLFIASQTNLRTTGSGVIDPFLTVQESPFERGFNTDIGTPLDTKRGGGGNAKTDSIQLNELGTVTISGYSGSYLQFLIDVNQTGNDEISLNQFQLFVSDADLGVGGSGVYTLQEATATQNALISFADATEVFRLNNSPRPPAFEILIDSGTGSGSGDSYIYVNSALFDGFAPDSYLTLFTQFGRQSGTFASNAGFEEIAVSRGTGISAIPEVSSVVMCLAGPIPLGLWTWRRRQRATA